MYELVLFLIILNTKFSFDNFLLGCISSVGVPVAQFTKIFVCAFQGSNVDALDRNEWTPLVVAVHNRHFSVVKCLIREGNNHLGCCRLTSRI